MQQPISIVIIADCSASTLSNNLRSVLSQQYEPGFEVIVVRESIKGDTLDAVKLLRNEFDNISSTYIPDKPQYITYNEVAIMLGTKAAKNESIILMHTSASADSETWLSEIADSLCEPMTEGKHATTRKQSFIAKWKHSRKHSKLLSRWCKQEGIKSKTLKPSKQIRSRFIVAYNKTAYLNDPLLRAVVHSS